MKLYVPEPDSAAFLDLIAKSDELVASSAIAGTEVLCAVYRKEAAGDLKAGGARAAFRRFLADCKARRIVQIPYGDDVTAATAEIVHLALLRPRPIMIRALDAIHVASAIVIRASLVVTTDARMREVAVLAKLRVLP
ncbi:MAG: type II toxin-antitoxin system VapC family toxin [Acidobacteriia bacterium]|nr:type II toxin-antitoxin system VapC family toxin [Terriglobia bacterium]